VIGYGSNPPPYKKQESKQLFLEAFPALKNKKIMLYISRIQEKKGCDDLIVAFSKAQKYDQNYVLVLAGNVTGKYKEFLKNLIEYHQLESKVIWVDFLSGELKWSAYYAADIFVLASHQENFGIAISEALSCGLPVLITNKVNIWREIKKYKAGIISKDNSESFRKIIIEWFKKTLNEKNKMRGAALRCYKDLYQIDNVAKRINQLLKYPHIQD
jgi:glycosyltransferase involved in cell wall biosynthesis